MEEIAILTKLGKIARLSRRLYNGVMITFSWGRAEIVRDRPNNE